jgi:hypothetical protein
MCRLPGCVAQAPTGTLCPVHATEQGRICSVCHGHGSRFYSGQGLTMACQNFGGTGLADYKQSAPRKRRDDDPVEQRGLIKIANE